MPQCLCMALLEMWWPFLEQLKAPRPPAQQQPLQSPQRQLGLQGQQGLQLGSPLCAGGAPKAPCAAAAARQVGPLRAWPQEQLLRSSSMWEAAKSPLDHLALLLPLQLQQVLEASQALLQA